MILWFTKKWFFSLVDFTEEFSLIIYKFHSYVFHYLCFHEKFLKLFSFSRFSGLTSSNAHLNTATWLSEYNFPAVLSRCKFPKTADALHDLTTNRNKRRQEPNLPPLPPEIVTGSVFDFRRDMFVTELKNTNNRNRLLSEKLDTMVYKIPDELWERNYPLFMIELLGPNIKLECRPHAFTEENIPVYTRTGKVAKTVPYPEDIVR